MMDTTPIKPVVLELVKRNQYHNDKDFLAYNSVDGKEVVFIYPIPDSEPSKKPDTSNMETWRVVKPRFLRRYSEGYLPSKGCTERFVAAREEAINAFDNGEPKRINPFG